MSKNNGGPAFPVMDEVEEHGQHYGLTIRDYFAAKAMQASRSRNSDYRSWADLAADAYDLADAMLAERAK